MHPRHPVSDSRMEENTEYQETKTNTLFVVILSVFRGLNLTHIRRKTLRTKKKDISHDKEVDTPDESVSNR